MRGYSELVWFNDYFTFHPTLFRVVAVIQLMKTRCCVRRGSNETN